MSKPLLAEVLGLSISERIQLVEDIWDSIAASDVRPSLTDTQRAELDRRLASHAAEPEGGAPWEEVRRRILGRA